MADENLDEIYHRYSEKMDSLIAFDGDSKSALISFEWDVKKMVSYIETIADDEEREAGLKLFGKKHLLLPFYTSLILEMTIVYAVVLLEAYLVDVTKWLFKKNTNALKSSKKLSYEEVVENYDQLLEYILEKEIVEFSYNSFENQLKFWSTKFGVPEIKLAIPYMDIIEIFSTRNILLHNNGVINSVYLDINRTSNLKLGEKRLVDQPYVIHVESVIFHLIDKIYNTINNG